MGSSPIQLPTSIQQVLDDNNFSGANSGPQIPGTSLAPAPQQGPTPPAPDVQPEQPIDHVGQMASAFINHLISKDKAAQPQRPQDGSGSFADKLRSAANNVGASFGDSAAATNNLKPGEGAISGIANTLAARNDRLHHERAAKEASDRQKRNDEMLNARNNIEMAVQQQRLANEKQEFQDHVLQSNAATVKSRENDGYDVEHSVSEPELQTRMANFKNADGKHWTDDFDAIPTGKMDVNGNQVNTYDIVTRKNEPVAPSDQERSTLKKYLDVDIPEGTKLSYASLRSMQLKAGRVALGRAALEEANGKELATEQKKVVDSDLATPVVQTALSLYPDDRVRGVIESLGAANDHVKHGQDLLAAATQHGDPNAIAEAKQNLERAQSEQKSLQNVAVHGLDKDMVSEHEATMKEQETIRHNKADESNKAAELAQKKSAGEGPVASPGDRALVQQIGEGRSDLPTSRTKEGQRISELVAQQYPDYDMTKGTTWGKSRNEYMGSGATAKKVVSYNTALSHMKDLYDHTTLDGVYNPTSDDYQKREVALNYVANEVGSAIKNGVMTEKEGTQILDSLKGGLTPGLKRERIKETASLLHDKVEEYQNKFNDAAPSQSVKVPILMSPKAGAAYDYVRSDGKIQPPAQQPQAKPQQQVPAGGQPILRNGQPVGYILNGQRVNF
jgi:hypothetical protein